MRGHLVPWSENNPNTRVLRTMLILKVRILNVKDERKVRKKLWHDEVERMEMFWIEGDVDVEADTVLCGYWLVFCTMMVMIDVVTRMIHI